MRTLKIRPHHILCISNFSGEGYSEKFVLNMIEIIKCIEQKDNDVMLVKCCDDICASCPNIRDFECVSEKSISIIDENTLKALDLCTDTSYKWSFLKQKAKEKIQTKEQLSLVCNECSWKYICEENYQAML